MKSNQFYENNSKKHIVNNHSFRNSIMAFLSGGMMALIAQFLFTILITYQNLEKEVATSIVILIIITTTAICTGLGIYDKAAQICGAGLFIPISGFANAMTSSAMECRGEGLIYGIGSNMFKLTGSVITYGIVATYLVSIIRYILSI